MACPHRSDVNDRAAPVCDHVPGNGLRDKEGRTVEIQIGVLVFGCVFDKRSWLEVVNRLGVLHHVRVKALNKPFMDRHYGSRYPWKDWHISVR